MIDFGEAQIDIQEKIRIVLCSKKAEESKIPSLYDDCPNCETSLEFTAFGFEWCLINAETFANVWRNYYYCPKCDIWVWQYH